MELTIEQALQQGVTAHKEGNVQEAERLYWAILQSQPAHPDANHNLGVIAVSVNKADAALPLFKTALEANPKIEQFWLSYIDALIKEKQFDNAKQVLEQSKKQGMVEEKLNILEAKLSPETQIQNVNSANPPQEKLSSLFEYYQNGQYGDAEKLAISITQEFPTHQLGWKVLGAVLKQSGRASESLAACQKSVQLAPQDVESHNNLGNSLKDLGRLDEAEASYTQAIVLKPDYALAHSNLGITLNELGRLHEAEASLTQAITLKPDYAKAHFNLGNTLHELGKLEEAEASLREAIVLKPDHAKAHFNLGNALQELGRLDEAEASYKQAIKIKPDYAEAYCNIGNSLSDRGDSVAAIDSYKKALKIKPDYAEAYCNIGNSLSEEGDSVSAIDSYKQALKIKPDHAEVHRLLTSITKYEEQTPHVVQMQNLHQDKSITEEQRCHLSFALAKVFEDLNDLDQSFSYLALGNSLRKNQLNYNIEKDIKLFGLLKNTYPILKNLVPQTLEVSGDIRLIFILGMPRSGTTLVEQIVSSHSKVTGAGELNYVGEFGVEYTTGLTKVNSETILGFKNRYLGAIEKHANGKLIMTDKMPQNFQYIGLIFSAFPNAKVIHVNRDRPATCWSNYKQYFAFKGLGYSYNLDDMVTYYGLYKDLMQFWQGHYGDRIYNLDYDRLTTNQEKETRTLLQYLGLLWEEACISPQNNKRSVRTASQQQVRQKVYQGSSQDWRKFEPYLNGAFDQLNELN